MFFFSSVVPNIYRTPWILTLWKNLWWTIFLRNHRSSNLKCKSSKNILSNQKLTIKLTEFLMVFLMFKIQWFTFSQHHVFTVKEPIEYWFLQIRCRLFVSQVRFAREYLELWPSYILRIYLFNNTDSTLTLYYDKIATRSQWYITQW